MPTDLQLYPNQLFVYFHSNTIALKHEHHPQANQFVKNFTKITQNNDEKSFLRDMRLKFKYRGMKTKR